MAAGDTTAVAMPPPGVDEKAGDPHDGNAAAQHKVMDRIIENARLATEKEQKMTLAQGVRLYPKAVLWSVLISTCIVMEGYDVCLINNFCQCPPIPLISSDLVVCSGLTTLMQTPSRSSTRSTGSSCPTETGKCPRVGSQDSAM